MIRIPGRRSARPTQTGETAAHLELKRLALLWAQENGYPIAALEVSLPQCRYRADVAAYRPQKNGTLGHTAVFECKQSASDLRRDDRRSRETLARLESVYRRRQILEKHLRIHYPTLRTGDTLFPEWDAHDFDAIKHRGYQRVTRQLAALQNQLRDGRKFEKLARYACANLFFLVLPDELLREPEASVRLGPVPGKRRRLSPTQTGLAREPGRPACGSCRRSPAPLPARSIAALSSPHARLGLRARAPVAGRETRRSKARE